MSQVCVQVKSTDLAQIRYLICVCSGKCSDSLAKRNLYRIGVKLGLDNSQENTGAGLDPALDNGNKLVNKLLGNIYWSTFFLSFFLTWTLQKAKFKMPKPPGLDTVKKSVSEEYNPIIFFLSLLFLLTFSYSSKTCLEFDLVRNQRNTKQLLQLSKLFSCLGEKGRTDKYLGAEKTRIWSFIALPSSLSWAPCPWYNSMVRPFWQEKEGQPVVEVSGFPGVWQSSHREF